MPITSMACCGGRGGEKQHAKSGLQCGYRLAPVSLCLLITPVAVALVNNNRRRFLAKKTKEDD